jgi:uncharacterized membrane protein YeiH
MPPITHDSFHTRLPYFLELLAVAVAAVSGVLAGRGKQVDLFGVLVLALVTAFGGGTLRDLMLGDLPVAWIRDQNYIFIASIAALVTFFTARFLEFPRLILLIADAFALALFSAIGARKALGFEVAPVIAVAMGVITGVAGGMVRDVLTGEIPLVLRAGIYLYATASMLGASVLVLLSRTSPLTSQTCMLAGIFVTLILRLASIRWRLVLPVYLPRLPIEKDTAQPPSNTPD